ncbi:MAG: hypothetical protein HC923_01145 [Myxococcales bacterium]|nr:hypothetical protein [Myxococcales bacterium]
MTELDDPQPHDKDSALVGPSAMRFAVERDYGFARRHGLTPGLAVIQVKHASPEVAAAIGLSLKCNRQCYDVAARIDEHTFGVLLGCTNHGSPVKSTTDVLKLLEHAATAAANAGSGDVTARTFWLKPEHGDADKWFREATLWRI